MHCVTVATAHTQKNGVQLCLVYKALSGERLLLKPRMVSLCGKTLHARHMAYAKKLILHSMILPLLYATVWIEECIWIV